MPIWKAIVLILMSIGYIYLLIKTTKEKNNGKKL
tara:strand:- start:239 stop:340 length:102 start_codon:yes stop_codon:yes gene_type:complete